MVGEKHKGTRRPPMTEVEQPLVAHLIELRDRLLRCVVAVLVCFLCLFPFSNELFNFLAEPVMAHMPEGSKMIATQVASPFLTPFKLSLVLSFFVAIPVLLYQVWAFVAPGLYARERKLVWPLLISSVFLFYLGMVFAYYVVFPLVFGFFFKTAPGVAAVTPDIAFYLEFVLKLFFAFGVAFEVPIATILLVWVGATTPAGLANKRPYIIVGAFVIGMLLTPPDVISQTLLAVPMWLLFEGGLFFSRMFIRARDEDENAEQEGGGGYEPQPATAPFEPMPGGQAADDEPDDGGGSRPMTEEEMDRELDRLEDEFAALEREDGDDEKGPGKTDR